MTIHPWTMYEVARYRDEERVLRAEAARRALRVKKESGEARADTPVATSSWLDRVLRPGLLKWARPHHVARHT